MDGHGPRGRLTCSMTPNQKQRGHSRKMFKVVWETDNALGRAVELVSNKEIPFLLPQTAPSKIETAHLRQFAAGWCAVRAGTVTAVLARVCLLPKRHRQVLTQTESPQVARHTPTGHLTPR